MNISILVSNVCGHIFFVGGDVLQTLIRCFLSHSYILGIFNSLLVFTFPVSFSRRIVIISFSWIGIKETGSRSNRQPLHWLVSTRNDDNRSLRE
jgi:hypothetical protein